MGAAWRTPGTRPAPPGDDSGLGDGRPGRRALRGWRQRPRRLPRALAHDRRRRHRDEDAEAQGGHALPGGVVERHGRVDRAVAAAVAGVCQGGVPAGKVGVSQPSADRASAMRGGLDEEVAALGPRALRGLGFPCLPLDAAHVRRGRARIPRLPGGTRGAHPREQRAGAG